jgi:hypothetical protein
LANDERKKKKCRSVGTSYNTLQTAVQWVGTSYNTLQTAVQILGRNFRYNTLQTAQTRCRALEEDEALFKAEAENELDAGRDRATPLRRQVVVEV